MNLKQKQNFPERSFKWFFGVEDAPSALVLGKARALARVSKLPELLDAEEFAPAAGCERSKVTCV